MNMNQYDTLIPAGRAVVVRLESPQMLGTIFLQSREAAGDVTLHTCSDYQGGTPTWSLDTTVTLVARGVAKDDIPTSGQYLKISGEVACTIRLVTFSELNFVAYEASE